MARPRFTGQGFTNPLDSLGLNAESRHRAMPPISNAFMSNEASYQPSMSYQTPVIFESKGKATLGFFGRVAGSVRKFAGKVTGRVGSKGAGKAGVKDIVGEGVETAGEKALLKESIKAQNKALLKRTPNPLTNTMVKVGGGVLVAGYGINVLGAPLVEDLTGANCGEKAIDAGYEEGTDEYSQYVEDCQGDAMTKVFMTGVAVLGVVGLVGFILLRPKKSAE
jgi:hypothetical protein